jgi:hypothetical protein
MTGTRSGPPPGGGRPSANWLDRLVAAELERHDPAAALARLPHEVRAAGGSSSDLAPAAKLLVARSLRLHRLDTAPPNAATQFLDEVRHHVALLLDLAVLRGIPFDRAERRREIAAFLACAVGEVEAALEALPVVPIPVDATDINEALHAAERVLVERFHPPGDPVLGLPLHPGVVAILRRRLARVAMGYYRDTRLEPAALARHAHYADREAVLLAESLAGLLSADAPVDERARLVRQRQVAHLGVSRARAREARAAVATPRPPGAIAAAAPAPVRPFLVEQLHLACLRARLAGDGATRFVEAFVAAAELDAPTLAAARVEAQAQHGDHQVWFEALDVAGIDWQALAGEWESATDAVVERVSTALSDNLGAIVTEIRQTGELGQLLARAASGGTLTGDEKKKVRVALIDLAKAVPALAIFAAPGGLLLLPLLAKLLPFNVLPSAWDKPPKAPAPGPGTPPAEPDPKDPKA